MKKDKENNDVSVQNGFQTVTVEKGSKIKQNLPPFNATNKPARRILDIGKSTRYSPKQSYGLTDEQVAERYQNGLVNLDRTKKGKSVAQIIFSNLFTFFNLIYLIISVALIVYKQYGQLTFLAVVVANTLIAIIQEIRSKKALDKLKLVAMPTVAVVRNGSQQKVGADEVVLDDVIIYDSGKQICADSVILSGSVEVNESILTGESEAVAKGVGDVLHAGSFVVANSCVARVDKVGKYNFIATLSSKAKKYVKPQSQLLRAFNIILYVVAIVIIPLGFFMWQVNSVASGGDFITTLQKTTGPLIAIIPAGPFLLTSLTLAVSVIRLAKSKTMVQELYCIEMLARVDTLCLDKTGTITDGTMRVVETLDLRTDGETLLVKDIVGSMQKALNDSNMTSVALKNYFGVPKNPLFKSVATVPFSSSRKFSAVSFENGGTYFLGAPEFILTNKHVKIDGLVNKYAQEGYRVLLLAYSSSSIYISGKEAQLPLVRRPVALIVIEDHIRENAVETLQWFADNDVDIKIISGDNPLTVSNIARKVGIANPNAISLEGKTDEEVQQYALDYTVFGRVSPQQKAVIVKALKSKGKTVAMTGDGVNDILALRQSDCSIAMAGGSDAARNVSHLVLLDNSFSCLTKVVAEGRRVVNNIQKASSMFFMKTVYTICLMMMIIVADLSFGMTYLYPYSTTQIVLLETFVVGLPTMLLALQPNKEIIRGRFLTNVFKRSMPASITFLIGTITLYLYQFYTGHPDTTLSLVTILAITYTFSGFYALYMACKPLNVWRLCMLVAVLLGVVAGIVFLTNVPVDGAFVYATLGREDTLLLIATTVSCAPIYLLFYKIFNGFEIRKK